MLALREAFFFWGRWAKGFQEKKMWLRGISGTLGQDGKVWRRVGLWCSAVRGKRHKAWEGWGNSQDEWSPSASCSAQHPHRTCRHWLEPSPVLQEAFPPPASPTDSLLIQGCRGGKEWRRRERLVSGVPEWRQWLAQALCCEPWALLKPPEEKAAAAAAVAVASWCSDGPIAQTEQQCQRVCKYMVHMFWKSHHFWWPKGEVWCLTWAVILNLLPIPEVSSSP